MDPLPLILYLCAVLAPSHGFSVDVEGPITFQEEVEGFGQSLLQFGNARVGGLIVGASLQTGNVNETGKVYKCDPGSRRCQEISTQRPLDAMYMSLSLSLAAQGSQFLVCGPMVHRACGENMYVSHYCFPLQQSFSQLQPILDTQLECPKQVTDIALLVDGSGSIAPVDFGKMKTFLAEIMKHFDSTDTQFALMQYSNKFELHFDFMEYRKSRDPNHLLQGVEQLHGTTYTATAIRKVVRELFTSGRGARDEATKVLIVITDGEKYNDPLSYSDAIPEAERAGIIRYAIGVGQAFSSAAAQRELQEIASEPRNEHVFRVDNFDALQGIQSQLQEKIFTFKGPPDAMNMSLGLSLAAQDSEFQQSFSQLQHILDTQPECPKHVADIALLIDGSGSIAPVDFGKMKTFLSEIMKHFRNTNTQFALMQYSHRFREHFNFLQYRTSRDPDRLLSSVVQLTGATHTATAIRKVVQELFTSWKGARDEATKVLIVITDGEKTGDPLSYSDVIPEAERAGIIRYAIGVGDAFSSAAAQRELQEIASKLSNEHVFRVDNFDALQGIQSQLQEKIFTFKGPPDAMDMSLHLSVAARGSEFLQSFWQLQRILDTQPECPKHVTDIALLIDGSGSIAREDFEKMKTFLSEIMKRFRSTDTQFALMQYSHRFREHFDFLQYRRSRDPDRLLRSVVQLTGATHTATAIRKVVRELFTSGKGARDEATKVLIVITDGEKTGDPLSYSDAVPEAERAGIIRYAIGVGQVFSSAAAQQELQEIASQPSNEHVFRVDNFDALQGIQSQLQEKFFAFKGYSSQVITANGQTTYMVGVPLCQDTGKVLLFSRDTKGGEWTPGSELLGEQNGSYFGSTLCAVDLDRDGNTDLVLIGAPLYHTPLNGGRVYICPINLPGTTMICTKTLHGQTGEVSGRFGASMSEIGDISGDGQMDVAIGAPMEDDNHGALYIFHGEKGGVSPQYKQRIVGSQFPSRLHYFGRAVSGGTDLTGDGLPDIAVGAQGQVLLLRSRPVLRVGVSISFQPPTIPTSAFDCQGQEQLNTEASRAEVCFTVTKSTMDSLGDRIYSTIQYSLALDPGRTKIRVAFDATGPVLSRELRLGIEKKCETYRIMLPLCPEDILTPITLRFNYTLTGEPITAAGGLRPILSEDSALVSAGSLPFQKDCGADGRCDDQLAVSFNFSGLSTLVVGVTPELNTTVSIQNHGENSYNTRVRFFYPAALSYRRVLLLQSNRRAMTIKCSSAEGSEEQSQRNSICQINHPIFWSGAEVIFVATFYVSSEADLGDRLQITATASSDNGGPITERMILRTELPVKYGIFIILTSLEESTKYVNFSTKEAGTSVPVTHGYEVKNLQQRSVPISVTFQFPVELSGVRVWDASEVVPSKPQLAQCASEAETPGSKDFVKQMSERPLLDCSVATCKKIRCRITSLEMQQPLEFMIKGNVSFQWVSQTQQQKVSLVSEARIEYEEKKYTQKEGFIQRQMQTMVESYKVYNYLPIIVGSSVGGLVLLALITAALYKPCARRTWQPGVVSRKECASLNLHLI
nr:integrin alpha-D-like [Chrysemys picta bellii]